MSIIIQINGKLTVCDLIFQPLGWGKRDTEETKVEADNDEGQKKGKVDEGGTQEVVQVQSDFLSLIYKWPG